MRRAYAHDEQVQDHPNLCDRRHNTQIDVELNRESGQQERHDDVDQVADRGQDQHDAQCLGEQPGLVREIAHRGKPQAEEDLGGQHGEVLDFEQEQHEPWPANDYPNLAEFATDHVMKPGYDYREEFEYGLDLILNGLEEALAG